MTILHQLLGGQLPDSLRPYPHPRDRAYPRDPMMMSGEDVLVSRLRYEHFLLLAARKAEVES